jgi:hypothetical protein
MLRAHAHSKIHSSGFALFGSRVGVHVCVCVCVSAVCVSYLKVQKWTLFRNQIFISANFFPYVIQTVILSASSQTDLDMSDFMFS